MIPILAGFDSGIQLHHTHHGQLDPMQPTSSNKNKDVQSKPSHEQHQRHERERHQQQVPPPKRIDRPDRRAREHEVDRAEAERGEDRGRLAESAFHEDVRAVVCDRVHAAELLPGGVCASVSALTTKERGMGRTGGMGGEEGRT